MLPIASNKLNDDSAPSCMWLITLRSSCICIQLL